MHANKITKTVKHFLGAYITKGGRWACHKKCFLHPLAEIIVCATANSVFKHVQFLPDVQ